MEVLADRRCGSSVVEAQVPDAPYGRKDWASNRVTTAPVSHGFTALAILLCIEGDGDRGSAHEVFKRGGARIQRLRAKKEPQVVKDEGRSDWVRSRNGAVFTGAQ